MPVPMKNIHFPGKAVGRIAVEEPGALRSGIEPVSKTNTVACVGDPENGTEVFYPDHFLRKSAVIVCGGKIIVDRIAVLTISVIGIQIVVEMARASVDVAAVPPSRNIPVGHIIDAGIGIPVLPSDRAAGVGAHT